MHDASDGKLYELAGVENHEDEVNAWVLTKWRIRGQDQIRRLMPTSRLTFECDIRRRANQPWTSAQLDRIEQLEDARRVHAGHADYAWMAYVGHERDGAWYLLTAWQGTLRFEDTDCPIGAHPADDWLLVDLPEEVFMSLGPRLAESWDYERISGLFASLPLT
jgi:hypothetical protein